MLRRLEGCRHARKLRRACAVPIVAALHSSGRRPPPPPSPKRAAPPRLRPPLLKPWVDPHGYQVPVYHVTASGEMSPSKLAFDDANDSGACEPGEIRTRATEPVRELSGVAPVLRRAAPHCLDLSRSSSLSHL